MNDARVNGDRRLGMALVVLILTLGVYAQCGEVQAADEIPPGAYCETGDVIVTQGPEVIQCVDGQWQPMLLLEDSEERAMNTSVASALIALLLGLAFGIEIGRARA